MGDHGQEHVLGALGLSHRIHGLGISEREAGVFGQRQERILLALTEPAAALKRGNDQATRNDAVFVHGRCHGSLQVLSREPRHHSRLLLVLVDNDHAALSDGPTSAPSPIGVRLIDSSRFPGTPLAETIRQKEGSEGSITRRPATSTPNRSEAPAVIASSTSWRGARWEIDLWIFERRSRSFCRSNMVSVRARTRAIPRKRFRSWMVNSLSPPLARMSIAGCRSSRATTATEQTPTPGMTVFCRTPSANAARRSTGTLLAGKPTEATTEPSLTMAPTSASNASAARSMAPRVADASSLKLETEARNSASCWVDQSVEGVTISPLRARPRSGCGTR